MFWTSQHSSPTKTKIAQHNTHCKLKKNGTCIFFGLEGGSCLRVVNFIGTRALLTINLTVFEPDSGSRLFGSSQRKRRARPVLVHLQAVLAELAAVGVVPLACRPLGEAPELAVHRRCVAAAAERKGLAPQSVNHGPLNPGGPLGGVAGQQLFPTSNPPPSKSSNSCPIPKRGMRLLRAGTP